jgi:hypothetical protein
MSETVEERQAFRQTIAAKQNAQVAAARALLGDAVAYGHWGIRDTMKIEPDRVVYCCRYGDGSGWHPSAQEAFGDLLGTRREDGFEHRGEVIRYMRYQLWFGALEEYHPMDPQVLAKKNEKKKAKEAAKKLSAEKERMPLLAEQIQ